MAENKDKMRSMMERLEDYLKKKRLGLNTEKTKIVGFRKERGKRKDRYERGKK